jgi:hypothetical protein
MSIFIRLQKRAMNAAEKPEREAVVAMVKELQQMIRDNGMATYSAGTDFSEFPGAVVKEFEKDRKYLVEEISFNKWQLRDNPAYNPWWIPNPAAVVKALAIGLIVLAINIWWPNNKSNPEDDRLISPIPAMPDTVYQAEFRKLARASDSARHRTLRPANGSRH